MPSVPARASSEVRTSVPTHSKVKAVEQIRRMRGGSQSHLMRCADGGYYVVKFQNNPQHRRILANEFLGTWLAKMMKLPTTPGVIVEVSKTLIDLTDEMVMELPRCRVPCSPGKNFGSRYFGNPRNLETYDTIPGEELRYVENFQDFIGMVVFDKWTCNCDGRQFVFLRQENGKFSMACIDQGFCFNSGEWNFPDSPLRGLHRDKTIYRDHVKSLDDFEPWLSRVEREFDAEVLNEVGRLIPPELYENDSKALCKLLAHLNRRRKIIRELLGHSCARLPLVFPRWIDDSRLCTHSPAAA